MVAISILATCEAAAAAIDQPSTARPATVTDDVSDEAAVKRASRTFSLAPAGSTCWSTMPLSIRRCRRRSFADIEVALWDKVMAVNLRGIFLMVKHAAPAMIAQRSGKIINISSGTAYKGMPKMLHYVTSKGGIVAFTRALSRELGAAQHLRQHAGAGPDR